ncbi:hypothetical protein GCM10022199_18280 [Marihabitans asiaticum]|uniref:Ribosomal protein S18 acetylase RimI-like enzyme n=1 Tax=Marihabitans asiaticum TaxID=415218 RepID=A0A560W713_9MICO|nr:ribosomal protein S18 acetylase RimI-like enzyme [Marihabitans asiaticum]
MCALLARQQPSSRYPFQWPLPYPVEDFVVRPGELAAAVAEHDGEIVGHVSVTSLIASTASGDVATAFERATGRPAAELAAVSVLFVDPGVRGEGVGRRLLETAARHIRALGRQPVLDVVPTHLNAVRLYRHLGWIDIGTMRPGWLDEEEPEVLLMTLPAVPPAPAEPAQSRAAEQSRSA